jgi:hypothetical protein
MIARARSKPAAPADFKHSSQTASSATMAIQYDQNITPQSYAANSSLSMVYTSRGYSWLMVYVTR